MLLMETEADPPFFLTARDGDTESVRTLLSESDGQSMMNYQDGTGSTPLFVAVANGHVSVIEQLIEGHCDVDLQDKHGS